MALQLRAVNRAGARNEATSNGVRLDLSPPVFQAVLAGVLSQQPENQDTRNTAAGVPVRPCIADALAGPSAWADTG
jgi:hypothetical protein